MNSNLPYDKPEIWGGFECTINRTKDGYRDQLEEVGHYDRKGDLERACSLGFTKFRYPILWERHYPFEEKQAEWKWTAGQLEILRRNNVEVIAGLVHHGSGPLHTDLADPDFPEKLAAHAKQVATRFPWINYYTPVNEPLTTARFSGLYGIWYPHAKDDRSFARMLINQLKGVVLSMKAIREINPNAKLVQTEDLSKTHSTPLLSRQADFENERRWLTYDFLMGKVNHQHKAWNYFRKHGIKENELAFFLENPCFPAIAGFNYYVTSERYLDEKIENYPADTYGGNGLYVYADTEAARSGHMQGAACLLTEAWWRFKIPVALTECQLTCTREQQMRWFYQHWNTARKLIGRGIPMAAITAWGLLGATDWDSLLSRNEGHYEPGLYTAGGQVLRPTALASMIRNLASGLDYFHPAMEGRGWWEPSRPLAFDAGAEIHPCSKKKLLIIGSNKMLDAAFSGACVERMLSFDVLPDQEEAHGDAFSSTIRAHDPWAVICVDVKRGVHENGLEVYSNGNTLEDIVSVNKNDRVQFLYLTTDPESDRHKKNGHNGTHAIHSINRYTRNGTGKKESSNGISSKTCFNSYSTNTFTEELLYAMRYGVPFYVPDDDAFVNNVAVFVNTALDLLIDNAADTLENEENGKANVYCFDGEFFEDFNNETDGFIHRAQHELRR